MSKLGDFVKENWKKYVATVLVGFTVGSSVAGASTVIGKSEDVPTKPAYTESGKSTLPKGPEGAKGQDGKDTGKASRGKDGVDGNDINVRRNEDGSVTIADKDGHTAVIQPGKDGSLEGFEQATAEGRAPEVKAKMSQQAQEAINEVTTMTEGERSLVEALNGIRGTTVKRETGTIKPKPPTKHNPFVQKW